MFTSLWLSKAKITPSNIQQRRGDIGTTALIIQAAPSEVLESVNCSHQAPYFVGTSLEKSSLQPPDPMVATHPSLSPLSYFHLGNRRKWKTRGIGGRDKAPNYCRVRSRIVVIAFMWVSEFACGVVGCRWYWGKLINTEADDRYWRPKPTRKVKWVWLCRNNSYSHFGEPSTMDA